MDIALYQPNRAMTKDRRQGGQVDPCLRNARRESVTEVIKDECKCNARFQRFCTNSIMSPVYSLDVLARIS